MKNLNLIFFAVLFACELQVDVETPDFESSLVLGSVINPDSTIIVAVTKDKYILDNNDSGSFGVQGISGASVNLFEDDELVGTLIEQELSDDYQESISGVYGIDYFPKQGREYRVEVESANFQKATAYESLPSVAAAFSIPDDSFRFFDDSGENIEVRIVIEDTPGDDYYEIVAYTDQIGAYFTYFPETNEYVIDSTFQLNEPLFVNSDNLVFEEYAYEQLIFEDKFFANRSYEINLEFYLGLFTPFEGFDPEAVLTIELRKVSKAYFNYYNSALLQDWISDDPFSQPVQVFSNVENGFGIFGSYVSTRIEVPIVLNQ